MKRFFLFFGLVLFSCDDSVSIIPYLDLYSNKVDILFVSETDGLQQIFAVADTALGEVWNVSPVNLFSKPSVLDPSWATDGRKFAFTYIHIPTKDGFPVSSNIWILNMDSIKSKSQPYTRITNDIAYFDSIGLIHAVINIRPDWSRDQKKIVFVSDRDTVFNIFVSNISDSLTGDSLPQKLTDKTDVIDIYCNPSFSPDGSKIVYASKKSGFEEIWVMNADGSNKVQLTNMGARIAGRPRFSNDGTKISFFSNKTIVGVDSLQIYTMNANGSGLAQITTKSNNTDPAWSPDGKIIFAKQSNKKSRYIYIMDADGQNERRLISDSKAYFPIWRRP